MRIPKDPQPYKQLDTQLPHFITYSKATWTMWYGMRLDTETSGTEIIVQKSSHTLTVIKFLKGTMAILIGKRVSQTRFWRNWISMWNM